jgi:long-chain fatty acid transport protein
MRRFLVCLALGALAGLSAAPRAALAQGYSVNEHSSCAMGRAGTAVASPCPDGSAMVYNPAGVALQKKGTAVLSLGGTFIAPSGNFTDDNTGLQSKLNSKVFPVPQFFYQRGMTDRIGIGLGVYAPYGLTTDWPTSSQGRYLGYKSVIRAIYVQPTVAGKITDQVMVGAGFDVNFLHLQLRQRLDLSTQVLPLPGNPTFGNLGIPTGTDFADGNLHGNATGVGYHLGLLLKPVDRLSLGVRYLSRQKVTVDNATAEFSQVSTGIVLAAGNPFGVPAGTPLDAIVAGQFTGSGKLTTQPGSTALRMPEQWTFGTAVDVTKKFKALFDVTYSNWTVFDTLVLALDPAKVGTIVLPEEYKKVWAYRIGGEYAVSPSTAIRLGYINHNGASPPQTVTPNLPEGPRAEFTGGIGARLGEKFHMDLAYMYIQQADRRGRTAPNPPPTNGLYTFKAHLFGATFSYAF